MVLFVGLLCAMDARADAFDFEFEVTYGRLKGEKGVGSFSIPDATVIPPDADIRIPMTGFTFEFMGRLFTLEEGADNTVAAFWFDGDFAGFDWSNSIGRVRTDELFSISFDVSNSVLFIDQAFDLSEAAGTVRLVTP